MAIQATPPVQLDPSMDTGHQLAFINQNFNSIASVLSQNSFVIVQKGTTTIGATNQGAVTDATVTHNLGYIPAVLAFVAPSGGSTYLPLPAMLSYVYSATPGTGITIEVMVIIQATTINSVTFEQINSGSGGVAQAQTVTYYLLQQTAN